MVQKITDCIAQKAERQLIVNLSVSHFLPGDRDVSTDRMSLGADGLRQDLAARLTRWRARKSRQLCFIVTPQKYEMPALFASEYVYMR